jgi:hypothetical protein
MINFNKFILIKIKIRFFIKKILYDKKQNIFYFAQKYIRLFKFYFYYHKCI